MSSMPVPPAADSGVFAVQASSLINAPRQKVWDTLLGFDQYKEWNPFVRVQTLVDSSGNPFPDRTVEQGRFLVMNVHIPPTMGSPSFLQKQSAKALVTFVDNANFRVAWKQVAFPTWLLNTERWQYLTEENGQTRYQTIEVFKGPLAYLILLFVKAGMVQSFQAMADGLKKRAEQP